MALDFRVCRLEGLTSVKVTGRASLDEFVRIINAIGVQTHEAGDRRVLVDLQEVGGDLKFTDHFRMGHEVGQRLQHLERLASVVPLDKITRTSEKVALTQGVQLRVFTSTDEAVAWLAQPAEPPGSQPNPASGSPGNGPKAAGK